MRDKRRNFEKEKIEKGPLFLNPIPNKYKFFSGEEKMKEDLCKIKGPSFATTVHTHCDIQPYVRHDAIKMGFYFKRMLFILF